MEELDEVELKFVAKPERKPFILFRVWQWVVTAFFVVCTLASLVDIGKLTAPGAPVVLYVLSIAAFFMMAVLHSPFVFFRLSGRIRVAAYVTVLASLILFGYSVAKLDEAYWRTPAGSKELAEKVKREEQEAKEAAVEEARKKAQEQVEQLRKEQSAKEAVEAAGKEMKLTECRALSEDVISQYKKSGRIEIIEINDISARPEAEPGQQLTCDASAITSSGDMRLQFGLERSPQGKDILSSKLD